MPKIEDIIPRQDSSKKPKNNKVKEASVKESLPKKRFSLVWKIAIPCAAVIIILLCLSLFSSLSLKAVLRADKAALEEKIEVSLTQESVDSELLILPGQVFEQEAEKWSMFQSTGKAVESNKASGTITVYNDHTPAKEITLVANTRFLSAQDGKIFRALKKIYLPKAQVKNGKVTSGAVKVEVVAQEPGEDYNIPPSKFSVPGLTGTALYYDVWAESFESMSGGFEKETAKITSADIEGAKISLEESLRQEAITKLQEQAKDDFVLHQEAVLDEEWEIGCFAEPDAIAEEFNCQGKGKVSFLGFQKSHLEELLLKLFSDKLSSLEKIREDTLYFKAEPKTVLADQSKMIVNLSGEVEVFEDFDQDIFLARIIGKKVAEIEQTVQVNYSQITDLQFNFWPFWVKKAPKNPDKIKLEIEFE